jgi:hypothetical protein
VLIGAGLGLTMLTLLIAVQQAVERTQLGVATSLNQFSRAIGGAFGVAIMGAVLTAGLATQLNTVARNGENILSVEQAAELASNPNALIDPQAKANMPEKTFEVLQEAMAISIHRVFWVGAFFSVLALFAAFLLPKQNKPKKDEIETETGEKFIMAEQTTLNPRNQPDAKSS